MACIAWFLGIVWRWLHVMWICRVSVIGVALSAFLLIGTAQARDLFADIGVRRYWWIVFLVFVFMWAWTVHAAARRSLQYDDWIPEAHTPGGLSPERRLELQHLFYWPALLIPRFLGIGVFLAVTASIWRTRINLVEAGSGLPEADEALQLANFLLIATLLATLAFAIFIWERRKCGDWLAAKGIEGAAPAAPLLTGQPSLMAALLSPSRYIKQHRSPLDLALIAARLMVILFLVATVVQPHFVASWLPRLFFVPLLLGGAVLLLGEIGAWSFRLRTPLLLLLFGLALGCIYATRHFHDVRWIAVPQDRAAQKQIVMDEAVSRWKQVNQCKNPVDCPRPILIAGAGGASRAAFLTATVVGSMLDLDASHGERYGGLRRRIFAMSTVSGSSVGAVVMRAAMLDAFERGTPTAPPCHTVGTGSWFGQRLGGGVAFDPKKSWRDCFQVILAGDFLTPVAVGLAYRDNFPLPKLNGQPWWDDRAVLLEQGFERRYRRMTTVTEDRSSCPNASGKEPPTGLCRAFGYHVDMSAKNTWLPLLFINGTSVSTGRRIITGDVDAAEIFPLAYDLNEIRRAAAGSVVSSEPRDIRLSTAATMSARFPIISPQGLIRKDAGIDKGKLIDEIVDGGYFENDGLATAADLADVLRNRYGLDPVVVRVINEPVRLENYALGQDRPPLPNKEARTPFDDILTVLTTLTATRSGHEDGHEAYARSVLAGDRERFFEVNVYTLDPDKMRAPDGPSDNPLCRRPASSKAYMENVSMSWWMSQPVQAYLDGQLCMHQNWGKLECELRVGRAPRKGSNEPRECTGVISIQRRIETP